MNITAQNLFTLLAPTFITKCIKTKYISSQYIQRLTYGETELLLGTSVKIVINNTTLNLITVTSQYLA